MAPSSVVVGPAMVPHRWHPDQGRESDGTCGVMSDGVIATMVAKFELERAAPAGLAQDLVAHADAKDGLLPQEALRGVHSIWQCRRVSLRTLLRDTGTL